MKKLMFMAVVAAATVASAAVCIKDQCGDDVGGTAYKVAISLKTTDIKSKTLKKDCAEECAFWREQKTIKINGLIWKYLDDCACDWIDDTYSYAFWKKDGAVAVDFAAGLGLIGKPDKKGYTKKVEAYGSFSGDDFGELAWAGFGSASQSIKTTDCVDECSLGVKSISGGIAGKLVAADFEGLCDDDDCTAVEYEDCCDAGVLEFTAAYGTIKISYDKSTAKKVALAGDGASITTFFKVPSAAAGDIDDVTGEITIEE